MNQSTYRERAGVTASFIVIGAYVAIGFVQYVGGLWLGAELTFDQGWAGAMNGLAGGAIGYLIGKQTADAGNDNGGSGE